jgi:hypothetical protein
MLALVACAASWALSIALRHGPRTGDLGMTSGAGASAVP